MTFTPGPWRVSPTNDKTILSAQDWVAIPQNNSEKEANAALISAAPELLEALRRASVFAAQDAPPEVIDQIKAAIAKARGQS